jgi:hypothetical protein
LGSISISVIFAKQRRGAEVRAEYKAGNQEKEKQVDK